MPRALDVKFAILVKLNLLVKVILPPNYHLNFPPHWTGSTLRSYMHCLLRTCYIKNIRTLHLMFWMCNMITAMDDVESNLFAKPCLLRNCWNFVGARDFRLAQVTKTVVGMQCRRSTHCCLCRGRSECQIQSELPRGPTAAVSDPRVALCDDSVCTNTGSACTSIRKLWY